MLTVTQRGEVFKEIFDTDNSMSDLSLYLASDSKDAPGRFADNPQLAFDRTRELSEALSDLFSCKHTKQPGTYDGFWIYIIKRQLQFEIELGLIKDKPSGIKRIKSLFDKFKDFMRERSKKYKTAAELQKDILLLVAEGVPCFDGVQAQLKRLSEEKQSQDTPMACILAEFKAEHVASQFGCVVAQFKALRNKPEQGASRESKSALSNLTSEEVENYNNLSALLKDVLNILKLVEEYKPVDRAEKIKMGLLIVALNDVFAAIEQDGLCQPKHRDLLIAKVRAIKNMGVKGEDRFARIIGKLHSVSSTAEVTKNKINNEVLKPSGIDYKKITEEKYDAKILKELEAKLEKLPKQALEDKGPATPLP